MNLAIFPVDPASMQYSGELSDKTSTIGRGTSLKRLCRIWNPSQKQDINVKINDHIHQKIIIIYKNKIK